MLTAIYRYITCPLQQVQLNDIPLSAALLVVLMGAVAAAVDAPLWTAPVGRVSLIVMYGLISISIWVVQSAITEFCAQLLGHHAPRLALFKALGMTQLPLVLCVPIAGILGPGKGGMGLMQLASVVLQILTIRTLYQVSTLRSVGIYFLPIGLAVAGILSITICLGVALW